MVENLTIAGVVVGALLCFALVAVWIEAPEKFPWYGAYKRLQKKELLKSDEKEYRDATEAAISRGFFDPRPDGWYGFNPVHKSAILYVGDKRFSSSYYYRSGDTAEDIFVDTLNSVTRQAYERVEEEKLKAALDRITLPDRVVIGNRYAWKEDS